MAKEGISKKSDKFNSDQFIGTKVIRVCHRKQTVKLYQCI